MISSMTGFGAARRELGDVSANVEVKSVNGRFLKVTLRLPPSLQAREHELEAVVRQKIRRGSLTVTIDIERRGADAVARIDEDAVRAYQAAFRRLGVSEEPLATLPGVLLRGRDEVTDEHFAGVLATLEAALDALTVMRKREGATLASILGQIVDRLEEHAGVVRQRAPVVVREYQKKLHDRLAALVTDFGSAVDAQLVAREVAIFADRCDITEELDRLASHLAQVRKLLSGKDEAGRTLDFLSQELNREINTMGSKSADAELMQRVVQMKTETERLREQVANVE